MRNAKNNPIYNSPILGYANHRIILDENGNPVDFEFLEVNPTYEKFTGLKADSIIGRSFKSILPNIQNKEVDQIGIYGLVALEGGDKTFEQYSEPLKKWFRVHVYSTEKFFFTTMFVDNTPDPLELAWKKQLINISEALNESYLVSITDIEGRILFVNPRFCSVSGYKEEELLGHNHRIINSGSHDNTFWRDFWQTINEGKVWRGEIKNRAKNGEEYWVSIVIKPILNENEKVIQFVSIQQEITERKKVEAELLTSEEQYQSLVTNIPGITYRCKFDRDWTMLFLSAQVDHITGYTAEELLGNAEISYGILIHKDDQLLVTLAVEEGIAKNLPWEIEYRVHHKDGSLRWVYEKGTAVKDTFGQVQYLDGFILDITERKTVQNALQTSEERYHRALSGAGAGLWDWDIVNNTVFFSKQWKKMLGYEDHEIPNDFSGWRNLWHPDEVKLIERKVQDHLAGKTDIYEVEHRLRTKEGTWRWILTRGDIEKNSSGQPIRWTGTNVDITERKTYEQEILRQQEVLLQIGEIAKVGGWEYDVIKDKINWSKVTYDIHELPYDFVPDPKTGINFYKEGESRDRVSNSFYTAVLEGKAFDEELLLITATGKERWVRSIGKPVIENGKCVKITGIFQDINEQKRSQEALRNSEQTLKTYIDASPLGIFVTDLKGKYLDVNKAGELLTGYSHRELLTLTIEDIIDPDHFNEGIVIAQTTVKTGKGEGICLARRKDGTPFWLWIVARRVNNEYMLAFCQDVSERIKAEEELNSERLRLAGIIEGTNVGTWEWKVQTGETIFNERWANIIGYTLEELKPISIDTWMKLIHPDDQKASKEQLKAHFRGEKEYYDFESRMKHKNGEWVWVHDRAKVVSWTNDGKPLLMLGTHQDITERKRNERDREYKMTLLKALFEESTLGIALNDLETGSYIEVNSKLIEPTGYTKEEFLALSYWDLTPKEYEPLEANALLEMREKGFYSSFEKEYVRKDGSRYPVRLNGVVVEGIDGRKHIWSIVEDISVRKQIEESLIIAKQQAESASKAKSQFLANMSHEIRTPLNGVIGFTELLKETPLSPVQQQYVDNANMSGHMLLGIINDILDFSKIEASMLHLERIKTDMFELLENSVDIVIYQANKKNLELLLDISSSMPRFAFVDPIRLKQVLANLLSNAVKFTEKGEVELKVSYEGLGGGRGKLSFFVRDTGIGINEEQMNKLFKAFSQADSSTTRKFGGTGLGLIISDMIIKEMGGKIKVESKQDEGSTFYFDIITEVEHGERFDIMSIARIKRCLIIDDNTCNRIILEHMLSNWGIVCESCDNGQTALKILETSMPFDVIICDYNMPGIDGLETIKMIRESLKLNVEKLPTIVLHSSSDDAELQKKCDELGIRFRLTKPVKSRDLYAYLCQVYEPKRNDIKSIELKTQKPMLRVSGKAKILIVEDVELNRLMVKAIISRLIPDAILLEAVNGLEAVALTRDFNPDLVLMDVQMPELDGLEATKQIRVNEKESGQHVPIFALTAGAFKEEEASCLAAGMDGFLTKPIETEKLKSILTQYCTDNQS